MEQSARSVALERTLAAAILAIAAAVAFWEMRSPSARELHAGAPRFIEIEARGDSAKRTALGIYSPLTRRLVVAATTDAKSFAEFSARATAVFSPAGATIDGASAPVDYEEAPSEAALAAAAAVRACARRPWRWLSRPSLALAFELWEMPPENIIAMRVDSVNEALPAIGQLLALPSSTQETASVTAEIFNGTKTPGLAASAAKMLKYANVDVLSTAASAPRQHTVVYDRTGFFEHAERARRGLGCPQAQAAVRIDTQRAVDVSILLGADCADAGHLKENASWN